MSLAKLSAWWDARTPQEKHALVTLGVALLAFILGALIF